MRLVLELGQSWQAEGRADGQRIRIAGAPALRIDVSQLAPLPDAMTMWAQQTLRADLPPGAVLNIVQATDLATTDGWKMTVIESQALSASTKDIVEARIHVFYTLLYHCATVVVRSPSFEELEAHRIDILDRLGAARPDWSGEVVALSQIVTPPDPPAAKP